MIDKRRFKKAKQKCVESFLQDSKLDVEEVQKTIDHIRISRDAYNEIFQLVQRKLKKNKTKTTIRPRPSFIRMVRQKTNAKVLDFIGEPYHITLVYNGKEKQKRYDHYNNIFFDLISLQKAMIRFYNLSYEKASGLAKFVIKLDEIEIIKGKKMERVSITLMNRALSVSQSHKIGDKFSV